MEDYTYHLPPGRRSRCSARTCSRSARRSPEASRRSRSIRSASAARRIRCAWCSTRPPGPALNASLIDLGTRFRLLVNEVDGGQASGPAETAGRARGVGVQARLQDRLRGLDSGRRRASHRLQLHRDRRNAGGLRHHRRHRVRPDRRGDRSCRRSSRTCAATKSIIIWRRASAPDGAASEGRRCFNELKREAYEANVALPRHGLINLTFGNASAIDRAQGACSRSSRAASTMRR